MAIEASKINQMAKNLKQEQLSTELYDGIEDVLEDAISQVCKNNGLAKTNINFFISGDHMLSTNIGTTSPLIIFVSLKANKQQVLLFKKANKASQTVKRFIAAQTVLTDEVLAQMLFEALTQQFDAKTKLYNTKNIIVINLENMLKIKVIVGYNFEGSFEYQYLNNYYSENLLALIEAFDKKEATTNNFFDLVRVFKSIELELLHLDIIKQKSYDKLNFIENIVYNVPNELLIDTDFSRAFLKSLNYLKNADFSNFKLASKNEYMFSADENSLYNIREARFFIKEIDYFYKNFEKLY
jgi:hypothetical protein